MATNPTYFQHLDFVVQGTTPQQIIDFHFPPDTQARIHELMAKNTTDDLSPEEKLEIEQFLDIEHIMVILKARALRMVKQD